MIQRVSILLLLLGLPGMARAQNVLQVLEAHSRIESRLFDKELESYDRARKLEVESHRTLRTLSDTLDRVLRNRGSQLDVLARQEKRVTEARELAYNASRELADLRHRLYQRIARMAELDTEIRREEGRALIPPSSLDGFWEIEFKPTEEIGLLKLRVEGTLITGTYRLNGGRNGSVRGTLADNQVDLERIDDANGFDSVLDGEFNPANRQITGGWTAVDLSGGRLGGGTWRARKLSPAEEEELDLEPDT